MVDAIPLPFESEETWRPAPGWEGRYEVSDHGRVRRIAPGVGAKVGYILKPGPHPQGYRTVYLSLAPGVRKTVTVHKLVATAFLGPCPPGHEVNHKDGDKTNNRATNLEWVTHVANIQHAMAAGLMANRARGQRNGNGRLTDAQVAEIRALQGRESVTETAKRYGIHPSTVSHIRLGDRRRPR
jgi:hypothetical protein